MVLWGWSAAALAQVQKVVVRTTGISCGVCAVVSEVQFRRPPAIDDVAISLSKETITLHYKSGAGFDPQQIRRVLQPLDVGVLQFLVTAQGRVREENGKRIFVAGEDRFVVAPVTSTADIPVDTGVVIEGVVNDSFNPAQVKILHYLVIKK